MRKPVTLALAALAVVLLGVAVFLFAKYQRTRNDYLDMKAAQTASSANYAKAIDAIAEIQDSLDAISPSDTALAMGGSLRTEQRLAGPNREQVLDRIVRLHASIERDRLRITQLETRLRQDGILVAGLRKMVTNLKTAVAAKETQIEELSTKVGVLQNQVTGLQGQLEKGEEDLRQRDEALEARRRELATIYYVVGTRRQLTDAGAIEARGGFLGFGKTLAPSRHLDEHKLTPLDTDVESVVPTNATHAEVVSAQAASSYELRTVNGHVELHILDAQQFRKVRQLVIVI